MKHLYRSTFRGILLAGIAGALALFGAILPAFALPPVNGAGAESDAAKKNPQAPRSAANPASPPAAELLFLYLNCPSAVKAGASVNCQVTREYKIGAQITKIGASAAPLPADPNPGFTLTWNASNAPVLALAPAPNTSFTIGSFTAGSPQAPTQVVVTAAGGGYSVVANVNVLPAPKGPQSPLVPAPKP